MTGVRLNLVVIPATDIDQSAQFYGLLGLEFVKHRHGSGPEHYASEDEGIVFEIYPRRSKSESSSNLRVGFQVASVDAVLVSLTEEGVTVVSPAKDLPWGRRAVVADPDGYRVELTEPMSEGQSVG